MSGRRGQDLQKLRSEKVERSFAHMYETGAMRRTHLRKHNNILKRLLFHAVAFNLALLVRKRFGIGKPRSLQGLTDANLLLQIAWAAVWAAWIASEPSAALPSFEYLSISARRQIASESKADVDSRASTTGC